MKWSVLSFVLFVFVLAGTISISIARQMDKNKPAKIIVTNDQTEAGKRILVPSDQFSHTAPLDTFILADYSFNIEGLPATQGWVGVDRTTQVDTFIHVADGTELNGGDYGALLPLEGNQSLWCGIAPDSVSETCSYEGLPGYGNSWDQRFTSIAFPRTGTVILSYKICWHSEPYYDRTAD
ncbi:MAG: hypothetical protein ABIA59_08960 [Candidatus Latescibacterota bacterium]